MINNKYKPLCYLLNCFWVFCLSLLLPKCQQVFFFCGAKEQSSSCPQEAWSLFIDVALMYHLVQRVKGRRNPWLHIPPSNLRLFVSQGEAKKMGKGFYISKAVAVVGGILAVGAVATIIALAVVYSQELAKNNESLPTATQPPTEPPTTGPSGPTTAVPSNQPWDKYRLPKNLVPLSYEVTLWPRLTPNKTTGLYIFTGKASGVQYPLVSTSFVISAKVKIPLRVDSGRKLVMFYLQMLFNNLTERTGEKVKATVLIVIISSYYFYMEIQHFLISKHVLRRVFFLIERQRRLICSWQHYRETNKQKNLKRNSFVATV